MDSFLKKLTGWIGKYRYAVLVLLIGLVLILIPSKSQDTQPEPLTSEPAAKQDICQELEQILANVEGVGKVQLMLAVQSGENTVYISDEDGVVIITDSNRAQSGLVERVEREEYRGAIVVCQGADSPSVRLNVIEAVSRATGLSTDKITVLKMK